MGYYDLIDEDFEAILSDIFSDSIVIIPFSNPTLEYSTVGIFDETVENVQSQDGPVLSVLVPRVTIWYRNFPYSIRKKDRIQIYRNTSLFKEYVVKDLDDPADGQLLIWLKRTNEP